MRSRMMTDATSRLGWTMVSFVLLLATGCSRNEVELGSVSGLVTLDDEPLCGVFIIFQPEKGRPALAILDSEGKFTLQYNVSHAGALVGKQDVYLKMPLPDQMDEIHEMGIDEPTPFPKKFAQVFETLEVKPGRNFFNLELTSS